VSAPTKAEREEALKLYLEEGPSAASRATGIPSGTIRSWASRAGVQRARTQKQAAAIEASMMRQAEKREELRELLLDRAVELLHRLDDPHIDFRGKDARQVTFPKPGGMDSKNYATAAAILIDKYRLEMGEATARTYHEGSDDIDRSVGQLVEELARRAPSETA